MTFLTLNNFFKKVINAYRRSLAIKATMDELSKLSDKELNDIGITRGDIWSVAHADADMKIKSEADKVAAPLNANLKGFA